MGKGKRLKKHRASRRARSRRELVGADGALPPGQRLKPIPFLARMIATLRTAPRMMVVDVGFDTVCRMHGYIPMRVLTFMADEGYVFVDDRHPHKIIGLTKKGAALGAVRKLDS